MQFVSKANGLSPCRTGFRPGCSVWVARMDLESRIKFARRYNEVVVLVTPDIAKVYDNVECPTLLSRLGSLNFPRYIMAWIYEFLRDRQFCCARGTICSTRWPQTRRVSPEVVFSPVLFNLLLSAVPVVLGIHTYIYADGIAFFTAETVIKTL